MKSITFPREILAQHMAILVEIATLVRRYPLPVAREIDMQVECANRLLATLGPGFDLTVERRVGKTDRLDATLTVGRQIFALEFKTDGGFEPLLGQISGYLERCNIAGMVVVTSRQAHRQLPTRLHDLPIVVCWIGPQKL